MGLPVPAGFTITTDTCTEYYNNNHELPEGLMDEVGCYEKVEADMGLKYDDPDNVSIGFLPFWCT